MLGVTNRKNKINLADYPFKRDIANRLFLSDLSASEVHILQELLFQPSKLKINDLAESAECPHDRLEACLDKFSQVGLAMRQGELLFVDKELRKYFEFQISKFSSPQEPSFEFLQGLLSKVPINVLPNWYCIPRTSDNIFTSIIEKYLQTPKIYESYIRELSFPDPIINHIIHDVHTSPTLKIAARTLRERYKISKEKFQEYMLLLEFHFVLVSSIHESQEVITPFYEWAEYLRFQRKTSLKACPKDKVKNVQPLVQITTRAEQEEAMKLFRHTLESWQDKWSALIGSVERSVYEVEKALRTIPEDSWILVDDFIASMTSPIGQNELVSLQRIGKRWRYVLPTYSTSDREFIHMVICTLLQQVGITQIAEFHAKPCFRITPFGRVALGEQ